VTSPVSNVAATTTMPATLLRALFISIPPLAPNFRPVSGITDDYPAKDEGESSVIMKGGRIGPGQTEWEYAYR
jgi:hypothetical protein